MGDTERVHEKQGFASETIQYGNDESSHEQSWWWRFDDRIEERVITIIIIIIAVLTQDLEK